MLLAGRIGSSWPDKPFCSARHSFRGAFCLNLDNFSLFAKFQNTYALDSPELEI